MYKCKFPNYKSLELPSDGNLNNPSLSKIVMVARQLSKGLPYINSGGCGIFALMLDSIFNGEVLQLQLIRREELNKMQQYDAICHEVLVKEGVCYDAYNACTLVNLLRIKKIKSVITMEKLNYQCKPNKFFLLKRNNQSIIDEYKKNRYNTFFANRRKMEILFQNYVEVLDSLPKDIRSGLNHSKVNTILDSYNPIMLSIAA